MGESNLTDHLEGKMGYASHQIFFDKVLTGFHNGARTLYLVPLKTISYILDQSEISSFTHTL